VTGHHIDKGAKDEVETPNSKDNAFYCSRLSLISFILCFEIEYRTSRTINSGE
jgi:hypothetical protein